MAGYVVGPRLLQKLAPARFSRASVIHSRMTARRTFGLAIWIAFRGVGGCANQDLVEIDRLRSGEASVLSITLFPALQAACHARLLDSRVNIFRVRFNFESAATSILDEPHKVGWEHSVRHKLHPDICGWAALFRF